MSIPTSTETIVALATGRVRGTVRDGVARYLGIPYAAPPFGDNRFAKPRPHEPWSGVRDAVAYGPTPPQAPYNAGLERFLPSVRIDGDEILNLNVWTPRAGDDSSLHGLPVMVWVYGGALTRGCNALEIYDGTAFARDGVVLVAPNYRVGAEGFSVLDGEPTNLGVADVVAALRWVQAEIATFGGDPRRVTVFGQSAGGGIVASLLASPEASGLFAQAIVQSAPLGPRDAKRRRTVTDRIARELGIDTTREAFAAVPPDTLVDAQTRVMTRSNAVSTLDAGYGGDLDDDIVTSDPWAALQAGAASHIPVLIGYTAEEYRLYFVPGRWTNMIKRRHLLLALLRFRIRPRVLRGYRRSGRRSAAEVFGMMVTDMLLRVPINRFADMRRSAHARTFVYEFAWQSPVDELGAAHAVDVAFAFDTLDTDEARMIAGPDAPQALADRVHAAWVRFATSGDPGWQAWDASRPVMVFDDPKADVQTAPREETRLALEGVLPDW